MNHPMKKIFIVAVICYSFFKQLGVYAQPINQNNSTNLIDTRNKGTFQGSCAGIAEGLKMSANFLGMEINSKKTQTPDEEWQKNKDSKAMFDFGDLGVYYFRQWTNDNDIPPSMRSDFRNAREEAYGKAFKFANYHDGSVAVLEAFKKCRGF